MRNCRKKTAANTAKERFALMLELVLAYRMIFADFNHYLGRPYANKL
jgi:hypothetical protein